MTFSGETNPSSATYADSVVSPLSTSAHSTLVASASAVSDEEHCDSKDPLIINGNSRSSSTSAVFLQYPTIGPSSLRHFFQTGIPQGACCPVVEVESFQRQPSEGSLEAHAKLNEILQEMSTPRPTDDRWRPERILNPVNGIVQPPVIPPRNRPGRCTNQLQYILTVVMKELREHPQAWPFHHPVDTNQLGITDYFNIVTYPMDLETVKKRLENNYYWSAKECIQDLTTVFTNCYVYNKSWEDLFLMALTVEIDLIALLSQMPKIEIDITAAGTSRQALSLPLLPSPETQPSIILEPTTPSVAPTTLSGAPTTPSGKGKRPRWSILETSRFFLAMEMLGTDFSRIAKLFPGRDRDALKAKYKAEETKNPAYVDEVRSKKRPFDPSFFMDKTEEDLNVFDGSAPKKRK